MRERDPPIARITRDRRGLYESRAGDEDKKGELEMRVGGGGEGCLRWRR